MRKPPMQQPPIKKTTKLKDDVFVATNQKEIENELARLEGTYCPTTAEKYQILLKRDNLLTKLRTKSTDLKQAKKLSASCPDMAPEKERYTRQVGNLLHPYECNADGTVNHALAVKEYARSAADQEEPLPHSLRPPSVLKKTMDYLILKTSSSLSRSELVRWYEFLWNRTRAIRKEITQQMLNDEVAVSLVEKCARFHIYASFCMSGIYGFDESMNAENLSKCLQSLRHLYDDLARKSIFCDSEPEFRAYDILMNLSDSNVLSVMHTYRKAVLHSPECKLAVQLACSFQTDNSVTFFRLIRQKATYLQACLCRTYFNRIRAKSMHIMIKITRPPNIPISKFTNLLAFNDDRDTLAFMKVLDLRVDGDGLIQGGSNYHPFSEIDDETTNFGCHIIQKKLDRPLPELIAGGPCYPPTFSPPVNSFVSDYYGKAPERSSNTITPQIKLGQTRLSTPFPSTSLSQPRFGQFAPFGQKPSSGDISTSVTLTLPNSTAPKFQNIFNPQNKISFPANMTQFGQKQNFQQLSAEPEKISEKMIEAPAGFGDKLKSKILEDVLGFCVDDFVWLSAHELKRKQEEHELECQKKQTETFVEKLPDLSQPIKQALCNDVFNFCIDDFIWLAAHEKRSVEKNVEIMLEKHNLRIIKPYAQKWLSSMRFRLFLECLPKISNSKRSASTPMNGPDSKRLKLYTPMKFSTDS